MLPAPSVIPVTAGSERVLPDFQLGNDVALRWMPLFEVGGRGCEIEREE